MYTNADCTIYHLVFNPETRMKDLVHRFYIPACFWASVKAKRKINVGAEAADQAEIIINNISDYLGEIAYTNLENKGDKWTVCTSDKIVKGNIPPSEDEYETFKNLERTYDNVLNVTSVDENFYGTLDMWNIHIGAK